MRNLYRGVIQCATDASHMAERGQNQEASSFEWRSLLFVILELILASVLFFVLFGVAATADVALEQFFKWLGYTEDPVLKWGRKLFKYIIVALDAFVVLSFITSSVKRHLISTWRT